MKSIPYARQSIAQADVDAVVGVLRSDWLTQGPAIERFEEEVGRFCGASHAIAVCNGTAALHLACLALGLGPGDLLWTSPNTFAASANCARYCGAEVDFVDIDPRTYNLSVDALAVKLEQAKRLGRLPKIVMPVHFGGRPCDMPAIAALADKYGFRVVEDASHAVGAEIASGKVGACTHSDIAVFSFHPVKIVTTGEGGMLLTRDPGLAGRLRLLRAHGITRTAEQMEGDSHGPWYYQQVALGYNYRMTDLQAALGSSQMGRLDQFLERRRALAARYQLMLQGLPLSTPAADGAARSSWHLYAIQLDLQSMRRSRREVFEQMRAAGIHVNVHYIPVYLHPYYRDLGFRKGACPACERYYDQALSLPMFFELSDADQDRVCATLRESLH